jgi:hypothetical protein
MIITAAGRNMGYRARRNSPKAQEAIRVFSRTLFVASVRACPQAGPVAVLLLDNGETFVDKNSYQPAAESPFAFESGRIPGCRDLAVPYCSVRLLRIAKHTACKEAEQLTAS